MQNPDIDIVKTEILSDNWYTLNKVTFTVHKKTEPQKLKAEKLMIGETVRLSCFTIPFPVPLF